MITPYSTSSDAGIITSLVSGIIIRMLSSVASGTVRLMIVTARFLA
jgi:hypothetical protein